MKLEQYRKLCELSQEQAAAAYSKFCGRTIDQGTWSKWERGVAVPGAQNVFDLARWTSEQVLYEDHLAARTDAVALAKQLRDDSVAGLEDLGVDMGAFKP